MENISDEELILRVAGGDKNAFSALSRRYSKSLYGLVYRMFYSFSMAEDVTQEVMLKIWRKADMWDSEKGSVFSWMYKIAVNHCLDEKRKNKHSFVRDLPDESFISRDDLQDEVLQSEQEYKIVMDEVKNLPERQRIAVNLFFYEGLRVKEVAESMGATEKAVENLLLRGKKTLREKLVD